MQRSKARLVSPVPRRTLCYRLPSNDPQGTELLPERLANPKRGDGGQQPGVGLGRGVIQSVALGPKHSRRNRDRRSF